MEFFKFILKFPKSSTQILHQLLLHLYLFYSENHNKIYNYFVIDKTFTLFQPQENNVIFYFIICFFLQCKYSYSMPYCFSRIKNKNYSVK